jgi:hypothetical protein
MLFKKFLRVGMIVCQFFDDFDFRKPFRMGLLIHPGPHGGNGLVISGTKPAEASSLRELEKLHLVSHRGKSYNRQPL